jgi:hypothetical protein
VKYYLASVILLFAACQSIRLAQADYQSAQSDLSSVMRACRLAPAAANYWLRASNLREIDRPDDPAVDAELSRALELNPRYTEAWIERALRAEIHGRVAEAERDYLMAERIDHMYKPAWALANFYLRQGHREKFWLYARRCLEVVEPRRLEPASYNPAPVFDLAWRVSHDPAEIRQQLIPPRHFIVADYLEYLRAHNQLDAGADLALELAAFGDPGDNFNLLNFCEQLINTPKCQPAVRLWNTMIDRGTVRSERLAPEQGASLSNPDLKRPFARVGFDWRLPPAEGVLRSHFTDSRELRVEFSGDQPESALILYQSIPVVAGCAYRLTFRYRTPDMDHVEGLLWQIWDYAGQRSISVAGKMEAHPEWTPGEARFTIPKDVSIVRLGLAYQRPAGSTRIHGTTAFTGFRLMLIPPRALGGLASASESMWSRLAACVPLTLTCSDAASPRAVGQTIAFCGLQAMSCGPMARGSRARDENPASARTTDFSLCLSCVTGFSLSAVFSTVLTCPRAGMDIDENCGTWPGFSRVPGCAAAVSGALCRKVSGVPDVIRHGDFVASPLTELNSQPCLRLAAIRSKPSACSLPVVDRFFLSFSASGGRR